MTETRTMNKRPSAYDRERVIVDDELGTVLPWVGCVVAREAAPPAASNGPLSHPVGSSFQARSFVLQAPPQSEDLQRKKKESMRRESSSPLLSK